MEKFKDETKYKDQSRIKRDIKETVQDSFASVSLVSRILIYISKIGPIPEHMGFIMDGNRRYAKLSQGKITVKKAHGIGFESLKLVLQWCLDVGIKKITVYAFSYDNFNRPKEEVDNLIDLAIEKFSELLEHKQDLQQRGIRVEFCGFQALFPKKLQNIIHELGEATKDGNIATLCVCLAYSSQMRMASLVKKLCQKTNNGEMDPEDINENNIYNELSIEQNFPLDILIRTSGEIRLSDFMLWEAGDAILYFIGVLWPQISSWNLFLCIFYYKVYCIIWR